MDSSKEETKLKGTVGIIGMGGEDTRPKSAFFYFAKFPISTVKYRDLAWGQYTEFLWISNLAYRIKLDESNQIVTDAHPYGTYPVQHFFAVLLCSLNKFPILTSLVSD